MRRSKKEIVPDEMLRLDDVLETKEPILQNEFSSDAMEDNQYIDYDAPSYDDEKTQKENDRHFRIAIGMFDIISMLVGIAVILVLLTLLLTLLNWLLTDIRHSTVLMQSGLQ